MEQFKIFAFGTLRMIVIMALIIVCINAITNPHGFIKATGIIALAAVLWEVYLLIKDTRGN